MKLFYLAIFILYSINIYAEPILLGPLAPKTKCGAFLSSLLSGVGMTGRPAVLNGFVELNGRQWRINSKQEVKSVQMSPYGQVSIFAADTRLRIEIKQTEALQPVKELELTQENFAIHFSQVKNLDWASLNFIPGPDSVDSSGRGTVIIEFDTNKANSQIHDEDYINYLVRQIVVQAVDPTY